MDALGMFDEQKEPAWSSLTLAMVSLIVHRRGDDALADQMAEQGLAYARESGFGWAMAICLNRQGRFASDAGDLERAAALYQESLRLWNEVGDRWRVTRALTDVADCAAMLGNPERAARLLGAAEALNAPLAPSLRFADDSAWRRAHQEAGASLAPDEFAAAWDAGRALSWEAAISEALAPLAKSPGGIDATPQSQRIGEYGLSPRELEVLELLVAGQTDREIAATLFISPRTAQGHVSNIFNKLAVNTRTAAVTVALRDALVAPPDDSSG
jgi:non-specific serine/threonine protein kinase